MASKTDVADLELIFTMLGERVTTELSQHEKPETFDQNRSVARRSGATAGVARKTTEQTLGHDVVSEQNYLDRKPENPIEKK